MLFLWLFVNKVHALWPIPANLVSLVDLTQFENEACLRYIIGPFPVQAHTCARVPS